jgi:hypothetical protein
LTAKPDGKTPPLIKILPGGKLLVTSTGNAGVFARLDGTVTAGATVRWHHRPEGLGMLL